MDRKSYAPSGKGPVKPLYRPSPGVAARNEAREAHFLNLRTEGEIRSLAAIALKPPMTPVESAYYHGPGHGALLEFGAIIPAATPTKEVI